MPSYYYKYKKNTLDKGITELIQKVETESFGESKEILDTFAQKYNVSMVIWDVHGNLVYVPSSISMRVQQPFSAAESHPRIILRTLNIPSVYSTEKTMQFRDEQYFARFTATLQPIDEASKVILMFMPYIGVLILIISIAGAFFYSKVITNPLLKINEVAKKMARLDFTYKSEMKSNDEIEELSNSLNELSDNLQKTMAELKQKNKQLKDDIEKEREMEANRREFVATISHELKSPITAVKGQIEAMIYGIGVYKDRDKYLRRSFEIMEEMDKLVKEVLEISRLERYEFVPQIERVDLSNLVTEIIEDLEYFSSQKQLHMINDIEQCLHVYVDKNLMRKTIINVINNAIMYSKDGEQVITKLHRNNRTVTLEVLNTGAHIEEKELEQIFKPFYRIEKSRNRNTGGSGLGLFIVQKILELHRIKYNITNVSEGVLFTIYFPEEAHI
ncbi:sensor histidine kinase [Heyndrickxia sp. NPDC080065]|uniref:sensor histidine kinase n=1 Tax=Heyndrickxia sp. NPDC080065 TaxID=3390568 RepID=UPI003D05BE29